MFLRITNIKAIEKQKDSYVVVVDNKYSKLGEDLYWINHDAFKLLIHFDGTKTKKDLIDTMTGGDNSLTSQAYDNLEAFMRVLQDNYGIKIIETEQTEKVEIPVLGSGKHQYPSAISLEITHKCNAKCLHCYGEYSPQNQFNDNTDAIIKVLREARASGTRVVELTGGEVTCHPSFKKILEEAYRLGFNLVSILSNGITWDEDILQLVNTYRTQTVVQIDLHGIHDEYNNWFMGVSIPNITERIKNTILKIHKMGIYMRVVTMITPKNLDQLEDIADWVYQSGIQTYGLSPITPMGRADVSDGNGLLLKTEDDASKLSKAIETINEKYGAGFLYKIVDGNPHMNNCGAFTSNPSITPDGNIKFCAMDDETILQSFGNVFQKDIGSIYTENYELLSLIRSIPAPYHEGEDCKDCEKKYFCSYCIIRGLTAAKEIGLEHCSWYLKRVPESFRRLLV